MKASTAKTERKTISQLPAAIAKSEKDSEVFADRTGEAFPAILKLLILLQMIPASWKKEVEKVPDALSIQDL